MSLPSWLRHLLPPLAILGIGAAAITAMVLTRPDPPARSGDERVWRVNTRAVDPRPIAPTLSLYGRLESPRNSRMSAGVTADVETVPVREGQVVDAGSTLVSLERADLAAILDERRANLAEARADLERARVNHQADKQALARQRELVDLAKRELDRSQRLANQEMASPEELDAARRTLTQARLALNREKRDVDSFEARLKALKARVARSESRVEKAERDLARTEIAAPFDGRITSVAVSPGERVRPGNAVVAVYDTSALEMRATIPGPHVSAVREALAQGGQITAEVRIDGRKLTARLDRLGGRSAETASGVEGLFRLLNEAPQGMPLGRFGELAVTLPPRSGVVSVPPSAVYEQHRLYVVRDGRLTGIDVARVGQKAMSDGPDRLLVRSSELRSGDEVVTTQFPNASEGLKVRIASEAGGR